jgi:hypothetical protein
MLVVGATSINAQPIPLCLPSDGKARVQQAQHVAQFDIRRIETYNFAANATQLR